jgi:hypothetical protein
MNVRIGDEVAVIEACILELIGEMSWKLRMNQSQTEDQYLGSNSQKEVILMKR